MDSPGNATDFFWMLDVIFTIVGTVMRWVWLLIWSAMTGFGIWILAQYVLSLGEEIWLEGTESEISIRRLRGGRVCNERSFVRSEVSEARTSVSGSNGS